MNDAALITESVVSGKSFSLWRIPYAFRYAIWPSTKIARPRPVTLPAVVTRVTVASISAGMIVVSSSRRTLAVFDSRFAEASAPRRVTISAKPTATSTPIRTTAKGGAFLCVFISFNEMDVSTTDARLPG